MTEEYSLESLNFVAFTKPNKHKMRLKGLFTTWPDLFSNSFATVGEFLATFAKFWLNSFFAT